MDGLDYSAHPTAPDALRGWPTRSPAATPCIALGPRSTGSGTWRSATWRWSSAVSAAHRGEAFEACRDLIDTLKATVPIWKHQLFSDGADEWVGLP